MSKFVVTENTPGCLPEEDEPPTFDNFDEAARYAEEHQLVSLTDTLADNNTLFTISRDSDHESFLTIHVLTNAGPDRVIEVMKLTDSMQYAT